MGRPTCGNEIGAAAAAAARPLDFGRAAFAADTPDAVFAGFVTTAAADAPFNLRAGPATFLFAASTIFSGFFGVTAVPGEFCSQPSCPASAGGNDQASVGSKSCCPRRGADIRGPPAPACFTLASAVAAAVEAPGAA